MAAGDIYTAEQLESMRKTFKESLGDSSAQALEDLDARFVPAPDVTEDDLKLERLRAGEDKKINADRLVDAGNLGTMLGALAEVKDDPVKQKRLISGILEHKETRSTDLVEALGQVANRQELVEVLVAAISGQKGVNPLIESLRYATISPKAVRSLAKGIAEQGTVNHLIRAIGTAPRNQPDAEVIFAMEVIRKGSLEQMLEALNLLDDASPGTVIVASGVVNRKDVGIEPLVRAMASSKNNAKAAAILALEMTKRAEVPAIVTLLERYISDDSDSGEILTAKLVNSCLGDPSREELMFKACRQMHGESMAGKILAMGILDLNDAAKIENGYGRMVAHKPAKQMLALGIFKKLGMVGGMRLLGKEYFQMSKHQPALEADLKEVRKRFHWIIKEVLGEAISEPGTAKAAVQKKPVAVAEAKKPAAAAKKK